MYQQLWKRMLAPTDATKTKSEIGQHEFLRLAINVEKRISNKKRMKTRAVLYISKSTVFTTLLLLIFGLRFANAGGGLLLYTVNGSPYVNAVQYEKLTSPSGHLSNVTVKGGKQIQVQASGIVADMPLPDAAKTYEQSDIEDNIALSSMLAGKFPKYAAAMQKAGELWKGQLGVVKQKAAASATGSSSQVAHPSGAVTKKPNAFWVRQDGTVEMPEIAEESGGMYMLILPGGVNRVGVPKSSLAYCSVSAKSWLDLFNELLSNKQSGSNILEKIATKYESHPEDLRLLPKGIGEVLQNYVTFNQIPERLRRVIIKRAIQESVSIENTRKQMEEIVKKYRQKVEEEAKNQPEAMEMSARVTKNFDSGITGPTSLETAKYTPSQQAALMATARQKARAILIPDLLADISPQIALLQIAELTNAMKDFELKVYKPAMGQEFPNWSTDIIQNYRQLYFISMLAGNLQERGTTVIVPDLKVQNIFNAQSSSAKMLGDESLGRFQLINSEGNGVFVTSPAIPAEATLDTRTLLLTDLSDSMKTFFNSETAKNGSFLMLASLKAIKVEKIGEISFVRAIPLVVLTNSGSGILRATYAQADFEKQCATASAFSLNNTGSAAATVATPSDAGAVPPPSSAVKASKSVNGQWHIKGNTITSEFEIAEDGYSPDKSHRLRELAGVVLLKTPEGTWTLSWQPDGSLAGKSDTSSETVTLKRE